MNTAHKGRRAEHRAQRILEAAGYVTGRAAGSKGPWDVLAFNCNGWRVISVKSGTKYASEAEKEALKLLPLPANCTREVWRFPDRCRQPIVEIL